MRLVEAVFAFAAVNLRLIVEQFQIYSLEDILDCFLVLSILIVWSCLNFWLFRELDLIKQKKSSEIWSPEFHGDLDPRYLIRDRRKEEWQRMSSSLPLTKFYFQLNKSEMTLDIGWCAIPIRFCLKPDWVKSIGIRDNVCAISRIGFPSLSQYWSKWK